MSVEQLALLAIALFAFMALVNMWSSVRAIKRSMRFKPERIRRFIGGAESARACAESILRDLAEKFPEETDASARAGQITEALSPEMDKARTYYLSRVEAIHKPLFNETVDKVILGKGSING